MIGHTDSITIERALRVSVSLESRCTQAKINLSNHVDEMNSTIKPSVDMDVLSKCSSVSTDALRMIVGDKGDSCDFNIDLLDVYLRSAQ